MSRLFRARFAVVCLLMATALVSLTAAAGAGGPIQVDAASGWVDTGISVMAGDRLSITAAGSWTAGGSYTGPDGYAQTSADNYLNTADVGVCGVCATTQTAHWGALVGYVGNNPPAPGSYTSSSELPLAERVFAVGSNLQATTPGTGELWLAMNDDAYSAYTQDNSGSVSASVSVSNNPPPGESATQRVLLYIEDPTMANMGNQPLHAAYGWQDPVSLTNQIIGDLKQASHGIVNYQIVQTQVSNQFPVFTDGFQYTDTTWESDWANRTFHQCPGGGCFDYNRFITENNIVPQINSGAFDEVWIYADPMAGLWESTMAGDGSYWLNSNPVPNVNSPKAFVIMGWNYERGVGEAIHSYGHRVENNMCHMYGIPPGGSCTAPGQGNNWSKFVTLDYDSPGNGGVGYVHCPVNGCESIDYDYYNPKYVPSNADNWYNYPNVTGKTRLINASDWSPNGADPQREYLDWWYSHIPHAPGRGPDGLLNDWWHYIIGVDQYKFGDRPPDTSITSGPSGTVRSTSATFTFSSTEPESAFSCSLDGGAFAACPSPDNLSALGQGRHTLKVKAIDHAGNVDPTPASLTWTADTVPPAVPVIGGSGLARHFSLSPNLPVTWTATDMGSGVASYDVRYRSARYTADLGSYRRWQNTTTGRNGTLSGQAAYTYCFSARARDFAGNVSSWSPDKCTEVPLDDRALSVGSGAWSRKTGSGYYFNTYTQGSAKGATLRAARVRAKQVGIVVTKCPTCGKIELILGSWNQTINLYASTTKKAQTILSPEFTSLRTGTLQIKITSTSGSVQIDGLGISRA